MVVINNKTSNKLCWKIHKGLSDVYENFTRSKVNLYAVSLTNKIYIPHTLDSDGFITATIEGLQEDTYDLLLIWLKNGRNLNRTIVPNAFKVSGSALNESLDINVESISYVYGYDGLSAYELAVLHGSTTLDEEQWINSVQHNMIVDYNKLIADSVEVGDYYILKNKRLYDIFGCPIMKADDHLFLLNQEWTKNGETQGISMGDENMKRDGFKLICAWGFYSGKLDSGTAIALYMKPDDTLAIKFAEI